MRSQLVKLPPVFDIGAVAGFRSTLITCLDENPGNVGEICVDATEVERIGTPGLQCLLATRQTMAKLGGHVVLSGTSDAFCAALSAAAIDFPHRKD